MRVNRLDGLSDIFAIRLIQDLVGTDSTAVSAMPLNAELSPDKVRDLTEDGVIDGSIKVNFIPEPVERPN